MDELKRYVDKLFAGHKETKEVRELKAEILGNLEARMADHIEEGFPYNEALTRAMRSLDTCLLYTSNTKPGQPVRRHTLQPVQFSSTV